MEINLHCLIVKMGLLEIVIKLMILGINFLYLVDPSIVSDGSQISFVKTSGLYQSDSATPSLTYKKFFCLKLIAMGLLQHLTLVMVR